MAHRASTVVGLGLSAALLSACGGTGAIKTIPNKPGTPDECTTTSEARSRTGQVVTGLVVGKAIAAATGIDLSGVMATAGGLKDAGDIIEVDCPDENQRRAQRPQAPKRQPSEDPFRAPIPKGYKPTYDLGGTN